MNVICPCCLFKSRKKLVLFRSWSPVINNVTYNNIESAENCLIGNIELVQCCSCGIVYNASFDESIIKYDEFYDNNRSFSDIYKNYLNSISNICSRYVNCDSKVVEIGCGKGDFLRTLSDITGCSAEGFDNSYNGEMHYKERVHFYRRYFKPEIDLDDCNVLILRHVLEHINKPYRFLKELCDCGTIRNGCKLFIEVPNLEWTLDECAYYDITYEHCNYFTKETLSNLVLSLGFEIEEITDVFEGQYMFLQATYTLNNSFDNRAKFNNVEEKFKKLNIAKSRTEEYLRQASNVCVWGASGKGVIFLSNLSKELLKNISCVVDINLAKQGKFIPVSGKMIESPDILKGAGENIIVIIMNKVYESEIRKKLLEMNINADYIYI